MFLDTRIILFEIIKKNKPQAPKRIICLQYIEWGRLYIMCNIWMGQNSAFRMSAETNEKEGSVGEESQRRVVS